MKRNSVLTALVAGAVFLGACSESPTAFTTDAAGLVEGPVLVEGTITQGDFCPALGEGWLTGTKVEDEPLSGLTENGFTFVVSADGKKLSWSRMSGTNLMMAVFVKGGPDTNVYEYLGTATSGTDLVSPLNKAGNLPEISHYAYCYKVGMIVENGCSPGYWKNTRAAWVGYAKTDLLSGLFTGLPAAIGNATLAQAIDFGGGSGLEGALRNLMRQTVPALLNAAHADVTYPKTEAQIKAAVQAAINSGNRSTILALAGELDGYNNLGCPIDNHGRVIE